MVRDMTTEKPIRLFLSFWYSASFGQFAPAALQCCRLDDCRAGIRCKCSRCGRVGRCIVFFSFGFYSWNMQRLFHSGFPVLWSRRYDCDSPLYRRLHLAFVFYRAFPYCGLAFLYQTVSDLDQNPKTSLGRCLPLYPHFVCRNLNLVFL